MPSRLSRLFSKDKENEAEADHRSHLSKSPPPAYNGSEPKDYDRDYVIDPPDLTAGFKSLSLTDIYSDSVPSVDHCIAHLKLLECFYRLRQTVGSKDGLFGIDNSVVTGPGIVPEDKIPEYLAKLSEKRWAVYVARAVDRFQVWRATMQPKAEKITMSVLKTLGKAGKLCDPTPMNRPLKLYPTNLPPVDVLMVWHAYMLNPRSYLEDCLRMGRMQLWHTNFPWRPVVNCINSETFAYEVDLQTSSNFTDMTNLPWNNLDGKSSKRVACPGCNKWVEVPYTTAPLVKNIETSTTTSLETFTTQIGEMLSDGTGFCDQNFHASCSSCSCQINHDRLRVRKFANGIRYLLEDDMPMGGTLLGADGVPYKHNHVNDTLAKYMIETPNIAMKSRLGIYILTAENKGNLTMTQIREMIEHELKSQSFTGYLHLKVGGRGHRLYPREKMGIRRMMSRYWENSSPFALDLVGAVVRQGTFIEKMHNIDWLHSPALRNTMKRLLVKYVRFVNIMGTKNKLAVPTLDVDLAWHTHQLMPYDYMTYTTMVTKQFIDHDDKIAETALNDAFEWTSQTYQRMYKEPYSECTCWYCEAVRESHTSTSSRLFRTNNAVATDQVHAVDQDPAKSVHISTHNAVRPTDDKKYTAAADASSKKLEAMYAAACERAKRKDRPVPRRDDYYYSEAWGYPVYIPAYSPYIGYVPFTPGFYPSYPACMAVGPGAAGNCCSGTCGANVAAGGCGGNSGAGCAGGGAGGGGGSGGGCGGSGGGGCGGGGGGGGGCGGGGCGG